MIRSRDGEPLPDGKRGELVLTTLTRERMPMLRFGTKNITSIIKEKCPCGKTFTKIERIRGRTDDILKVRGKR